VEEAIMPYFKGLHQKNIMSG